MPPKGPCSHDLCDSPFSMTTSRAQSAPNPNFTNTNGGRDSCDSSFFKRRRNILSSFKKTTSRTSRADMPGASAARRRRHAWKPPRIHPGRPKTRPEHRKRTVFALFWKGAQPPQASKVHTQNTRMQGVAPFSDFFALARRFPVSTRTALQYI